MQGGLRRLTAEHFPVPQIHVRTPNTKLGMRLYVDTGSAEKELSSNELLWWGLIQSGWCPCRKGKYREWKRWGPSKYLERSLGRNWLHQHLETGFPAPRTGRKQTGAVWAAHSVEFFYGSTSKVTYTLPPTAMKKCCALLYPSAPCFFGQKQYGENNSQPAKYLEVYKFHSKAWSEEIFSK